MPQHPSSGRTPATIRAVGTPVEAGLEPVVELGSRAELVRASGDDVYVRSSTAETPGGAWADASAGTSVRAWRCGSGVAWFQSSRRRAGSGWLNVAAEPAAASALVTHAVAELGDELTGLTVPAAALPLLDPAHGPATYNLWDWFWTATPPPEQPAEPYVRWATDDDLPAITGLLDTDSPRHSARPGDDDVRRWCVLEDPVRGDVVACAAWTEHQPGVPHLASIVTRTERRGAGLGAAITAWLTRRLLAEGGQVVTLGMYADNEPARHVYRKLGYVDSHHFASGFRAGLDPRQAPGGDHHHH